MMSSVNMVRSTILISIYICCLASSQQISRDSACDLSADRETIVQPTTVEYRYAFSAKTISPKILYADVVDQFTMYADMFNEEVREKLTEEYASLGASDVTAIRFLQSDHSEFASVDFVVSCENNVTHDVITASVRNVATNTDYIDLASLEVYKNVIYCLRQEFKTKVGTFTWPITLAGTTVFTEESCSTESVNGGKDKLAVRKCLDSISGAYWDSFKCTDCGGPSASYLLQQLYESLPNGDSVEELIREVANITERTYSIRVDGIDAAVKIIEYIVEETPASSITTEIADTLVRVVHNIQLLPSKTIAEAQGRFSTSSRLLRALHNVLTSMELTPNVQFTSLQDSIIVFADEQENSGQASSTWAQFGVLDSPSSDSITAGGLKLNLNEASLSPVGNTMMYVQNMPEIVNYRRVFLLHQDDVLFRSAADEIRLSADNSEYIREINTRIVTAIATGDSIGEPQVNAYFKPIKVMNKTLNEECQTWDWTKGDTGQGGWSEEGCSISMEGEYFHCSCNSYASFAVAMDVYEVPIIVPPDYVISKVGSGIAAILLLLTILIFVCLKDLRNSKPHQILAHLFLALVIWHLSFVIGVSLTRYREACVTFGVLMHYGIIVSLCWMIVGAIDIYIVFVKARALPVKRFVVKSSILSWGMPLIIVAIVAAIDLDNYREEDKYCFLVTHPAVPFILSLAVPIFAAVCSISIVYYMACTMHVRMLNDKIEDEGDPMFRKRQQARVLVLASSVIVILGIMTAIFGFIAIYTEQIGTEVLFMLCSVLEGVAIFGTCCVWPIEVRHLWLKKLGVLKKNPTKQGLFRPYWSLSKWNSKSVLPETEPQFFLDNSTNANGIVTPQNIVLGTFPKSETSNSTESKA
ncbi:adhesion G-protein coupled receptor G4-like [Antedon mediterranea]|uniref:adhesion G-protein coupled receptor G4-like n=1 Tax=Antedon mediterranea TaxID=105859 RepID=UPI003AF6CC3A